MEALQTTVFLNSDSQWTADPSSVSDPTRSTTHHGSDDSLASFFSRPLVSTVLQWVPSSVVPLSYVFDPWTTFFSNPRVANRLTNYTLLNCNLRVKFMINGNSFYYGKAMVDYVPLFTEDQVTATATLPLENIVGASQRLHIYLDPTLSQGGELVLPFAWYYDSLRINTEEWVNMGQLFVREIVPLKHANAAVTPVQITVSIWAENVEFSVPTTVDMASLLPQAKVSSNTKDEYGTGIVSQPASAIAAASGKLAAVPAFRPFALATQMVASAVGGFASMFGFSRPCIVSDIVPIRPSFIGTVGVTDTGDTSQKLTVTSKQETTVDPRITGVDMGDNLVLSKLAAVESFITQFQWAVAKVSGDHLFNIRCTPHVCRFSTPYFYMPACMFVARPFKYWRGTMRYRIQVVASAFHKGRLRLVYDPNYVASLESNVGFTRVIDLDQERDITVDVQWSQPISFLANSTMANSSSNYSTTAFATTSGLSNGTLAVYVLNTLTTPNSTTNNDILINVFVSMIDGEFASPVSTDLDTLVNSYQYTPQSGESDVDSRDANAPAIEDCTVCMSTCHPSDDMYKVYFGEKITSFRQLLRRYVYHSSYVFLTGSVTVPTLHTVNIPDYPSYRGYSISGIHTPTLPGKYNYMNSTLLQYLAPAFAMSRGSQRSKYHAHCSAANDLTSFAVTRDTGTSFNQASTNLVITSTSTYAKSVVPLMRGFYNGAAVTPCEEQPILEVEFPYYKPTRFDLPKNVSNSRQTYQTGFNAHTLRLLASGASTKYIDRYTAVGEDFTLNWFQGAPPMAVLTDPA